MIDLVVPQVEFGDETLLLARWLERDGARVKRGQPLLVFEASKVAIEIASPVDGFLRRRMREGAMVSTGSVAGHVVVSEAEDAEEYNPSTARATKRALALARSHDVDIAELGGGGIVTERAVRAAIGSAVPGEPSAPRSHERALDALQLAVGRKVRQALDSHVHAFVLGRHEVESSQLHLERELARGVMIPFGDLVVYQVARCLRELPRLNAYAGERTVHEYEQVNVAFTVEVDGRLYAPVVHDADRLTLEETTARMQALKLEVLRGKPPARSLLGGTFTVSTLDAEGLEYQLPIINGAQGAILGVGACRREFVPGEGDSARVARFRGFCLAYDHRLVNGAGAAQFLGLLGKKMRAGLA